MIKITKRALLTPEFKSAVLKAAYDRLHRIRRDYDRTHPLSKKNFMRINGIQIALLKELLSDAGKKDQLWTRMRTLQYDEFATEEWGGTTYLRATTKDITVEEDNVNIGPYWVYINVNDYVMGDTKDIHFVPIRDPLNGQRFFHHYAKGPRFVELGDPRDLQLTHHLDAKPETCWGSFGGFATAAFEAMDTAELFRTLHVYLSRHNDSSNLWGTPGHWSTHHMDLPFARPL